MIPKSKEPSLPRFASPLNTRKRLRMAISGLSTPVWRTGSTNLSRSDKRANGLFYKTVICILIFITFESNCILATPLNSICIGSHNLHGFKKSVNYHKECLSTHKGVWFSQELWLQESQLSQLQQLGVQFSARSGMGHATSAGILRGRPFGGVAIAWSHDLDHVIKPVANFRHKRVVAVELQSQNDYFLLISVYMPFFDAGNKEECLAETQDALSMVDLLIDNHPQHRILIGGDLNTELKGESPFDPMWRELMTRYTLASCSSKFSSPGYTYFHESLGHKKFNDHFILSQSLLTSNYLV